MRPVWLPFLAWSRPRRAGLWADGVAGLTVAVVAIPQALAYAQLAGVPAHLGLYAAFLPTMVAALFGACVQLSTGPVALTALLTAASLAPLAAPGSQAWIEQAMLLAIGAGLLQLAAGFARMGRWVERLPASLMIGFANAAALLIMAAQLPTLVGLKQEADSGTVDVLHALLASTSTMAHRVDPLTAAFGIGSVLALGGLRRVWPRAPAALVVIVGALALQALTGGAAAVAVVGDLPTGWPTPTRPPLDPATVGALLPAMLAVAVISFIEVTSSARVIAVRTGVVWNINQELVGQGLAKLASGLSGAFPVSGSFSRSALNLAAGAVSPLSSVVCAALVGLALLVAGHVLHALPTAVLAAVILTTVGSLLTPRGLLALWRQDRREGWVALLTLLATLASAPRIHYGLLAGLAAVAVERVCPRR